LREERALTSDFHFRIFPHGHKRERERERERERAEQSRARTRDNSEEEEKEDDDWRDFISMRVLPVLDEREEKWR